MKDNHITHKGTNDMVYASTPTFWTRHWRVNIFWQAWRFVVLNLKIIRIVILGHS